VDLGKGLPEVIKLKVDEWSHIQQLDYEQIPFKCKVCHKYSHFANRCPKLVDAENDDQEGHWEPVKKKKFAPASKAPLESDPPVPSAPHPPSSSPPLPAQTPPDPSLPSSSNPFFVLSSLNPLLDDPSLLSFIPSDE